MRDRQQVGEQRRRGAGFIAGAGDQGFELAEPACVSLVGAHSGGEFELLDDRIEGAVGVVRRALVEQAEMALGRQALMDDLTDARLADAGLARDQHHLAFARHRLVPAPG